LRRKRKLRRRRPEGCAWSETPQPEWRAALRPATCMGSERRAGASSWARKEKRPGQGGGPGRSSQPGPAIHNWPDPETWCAVPTARSL